MEVGREDSGDRIRGTGSKSRDAMSRVPDFSMVITMKPNKLMRMLEREENRFFVFDWEFEHDISPVCIPHARACNQGIITERDLVNYDLVGACHMNHRFPSAAGLQRGGGFICFGSTSHHGPPPRRTAPLLKGESAHPDYFRKRLWPGT